MPELTNPTVTSATFFVKPGMKQKFLDYGAKHQIPTDYGTTYSIYESATYLELAPDPVEDVNADGHVNAADVVSIYNYIINGAD